MRTGLSSSSCKDASPNTWNDLLLHPGATFKVFENQLQEQKTEEKQHVCGIEIETVDICALRRRNSVISASPAG